MKRLLQRLRDLDDLVLSACGFAPRPRTLFWVGGPGNVTWPKHWSLRPNGEGGVHPPRDVDNVVIYAPDFEGSHGLLSCATVTISGCPTSAVADGGT